MLSSQEKRIAAARILTTLLCSISVTCLWIDKPDLAGPFTFLSLTFPYSCVGKVVAAYATRHHGYGPASRAIPAIFLVFMGLLAGFLRSVSPRLMVPARMAAITSVFLLTTNIGVSDVSKHSFGRRSPYR
ncbi:hypothetical protein DL93DRAFT_1472196 [Clavulina sp. PMI_390]|nr:hypothetical protein DL93DRAFT_1472196 [Clavulina sp. PMI_390]